MKKKESTSVSKDGKLSRNRKHGQIVLPLEIRKALGWEFDEPLHLIAVNGELRAVPKDRFVEMLNKHLLSQ